ncbi:motility associated factor glycosyltransferase family protein [Viridibacillus arvi]|uniref:motility associated factor glycosyltransferase family protein n=1 Tax=Viridibacillus arvi TaxID=263475 RepID=UPI003CFC3362
METQMNVENIETKSEYMTLKVNGFFLHSKYDPQKESSLFAEKSYKPHFIHILFGYGLGYIADSLVQQFKYGETLIVIDPLLDSGLIKVQDRHREKELKVYNSYYIQKLENLLEGKTKEYQRTIQVVCSPNYEKIFPEIYVNLLREVKSIQQNNEVNEATIRMFAEVWQKNFSENLISILENGNLSNLYQAYDYPVVVASGGPSLTKQLPLLKEIQENVIIIAAGSTINSLLAYGIEPDYVVSVDGGEANYNHFMDLKLNKARLIFSAFNHPLIINSFENESYAFVASRDHFIQQYLHDKFNITIPKIVGGGTVAHYAFSIAQYISSGPVALIGQDLAYTNSKTHAISNKHEQEIDKNFMEKNRAFKTKGYYGDDVITSPVFYSMKTTFEQIIDIVPPKVPVYNCTEGGVYLKGFSQKSFTDFTDEFVEKKATIKNHLSNETIPLKWDKVIKVLESEIQMYNKIKAQLNSGLQELTINKSNNTISQKTLMKLEKIDKKIAAYFKEVSMEYIVAPITTDVLRNYLEQENETNQEKYNRVYKQTKELYSRLIEATNQSQLYTKDVINRIIDEKLPRNEDLK